MGNLTTQTTKALSLERQDFEEWLAGRIETLLSHYYRPGDGELLATAAATDWLEILGGLTRDAVSKACLEYIREETRRPTPGAIYQLAQKYMPRPTPVPKQEDPQKERVTQERAEQILREAGCRLNEFGGVVSLGGEK